MTALDPAAVDALLARARRDVDDGLLPACQLALALDGEVLVHETFGEATDGTRFPMYILREHRRTTALSSLAGVCAS